MSLLKRSGALGDYERQMSPRLPEVADTALVIQRLRRNRKANKAQPAPINRMITYIAERHRTILVWDKPFAASPKTTLVIR